VTMFFLDPEAHDRLHMQAQERNMRINRFMDEMSADDAFTFFQILTIISKANDPTSVSQYLAGQMYALLRRIHQVCTNCGEKHEPTDHEEWEIAKEKKEEEDAEKTQEVTTEDSGNATPEETD
jgi:NADH pyrophosphatase NudC (nudix superfamily)